MEDKELLNLLVEEADEISYAGSTKLEDYSHRYSVTGGLMQEELGETGPINMKIGDEEAAEYQIANRYRAVLRTSKPVNKLLEGDKTHSR